MIKYRKITDISLVTDISKNTIYKVPIRYRYPYIDIGDISSFFIDPPLSGIAYSHLIAEFYQRRAVRL